jgi:RNA recognition motif-containing protein
VNIYVGNLPLEMTEDELRQEFTAFGQIISVSVMNDKYIGSGQPRGYGFVEMASKSEGAVAVASLNGKTIRGRLIEVVEALPLSGNKDKRSFHSRTGSHFSVKRQRGYQE